MKFQPQNFYHKYNRGNNKQTIFPRKENYDFFVNKIKIEICPNCSVVAYCLMPNHFHLLLYVSKDEHLVLSSGKMQVLQRKLGTLQSAYTRAINNQKKKTGALFQPKLKVVELDEEHSIPCFHYVHQNPIKDGLSANFQDWKYSSYNEYCDHSESGICNRQIAYDLLRISSNVHEFKVQSREIIINEEVLLRLKGKSSDHGKWSDD